jgi:hypothetical protein
MDQCSISQDNIDFWGDDDEDCANEELSLSLSLSSDCVFGCARGVFGCRKQFLFFSGPTDLVGAVTVTATAWVSDTGGEFITLPCTI